MAATQTSQLNGTAKQLANEAIESILTARETANVTWTQIQNTGSGGIFIPGFVAIDCPGVDGIVGTADDAACGPQILEQPGPSGVFAGNCPLPGPDTCLTSDQLPAPDPDFTGLPPGWWSDPHRHTARNHDYDPVPDSPVQGSPTVRSQHIHFGISVREKLWDEGPQIPAAVSP